MNRRSALGMGGRWSIGLRAYSNDIGADPDLGYEIPRIGGSLVDSR